MNRAHRFLALLIFVAAVVSGCATVGQRAADRLDTGSVTQFKLENGPTVIVEERHSSPVAAVALWLGIGACQDGDSLAGIAHFIEHMFFKGTEKFPTGEVDRQIENLGGSWNGGTSYDYTEYYVVVGSEHVDPVMAIMGDVARNASFAPLEVEHERLVVMEEIRMDMDNPWGQIWDQFMAAAFVHHPYRRPILGTMDTVGRMKRDDLVKHYRRYYTPENLTLVVVGDVDPDVVRSLAENHFGSPGSGRPCGEGIPEVREEVPLAEPRRVRITRELDHAYLTIGFHSPRLGDDDDAAADVLAAVLGEGRASRLVRVLKEERGIVSEIGAGNYSMRDAGVFYIDAECPAGGVEEVELAILEVIEGIVRDGVSPDEVGRARAVLRAGNVFDRETVDGEAEFLGYWAVTGGLESGLSYLERIDGISASDVHRAAKRYLSRGHVLAAISPPAPAPQDR
jgi:zinc protease